MKNENELVEVVAASKGRAGEKIPPRPAKHYEDAFYAVFGAEADVVEPAVTVVGICYDIDRVLARLQQDSKDLAERCAYYADSLAAGSFSASAPSDYSVVADIARGKQELNDKREQLTTLIRVLHGKEKLEAFRDAVDASFKVARKVAR